MNTSAKHSSNILLAVNKSKDKYFEAQMKRVFKAFSEHPKTMLMVSIETGILRANICRYVAEWEKENRIAVMKKGICPISKHIAGFYTTKQTIIKNLQK